MLIKTHLCKYVVQVDTKMRDQVWMKLKCFPDVLFGFCCVPSSKSLYFDFALLSYIQGKVKSREHGYSCIIVGDLNV